MPNIINHSKNIISKKAIRIDEISPGDIVQFRYTAENVYDKKPLVFVLFEKQKARGRKGKSTKVKKTGRIAGINLHYLSNFAIQKLHEEDNFLRLKKWNLYQNAFRTFSVQEVQSLKRIEFKTNKQIREEKLNENKL